MFETKKSILFATNLSKNCRRAFEVSISLSARYQVNLILLHVLERNIPLHVEGTIRDSIGEEKWEELQKMNQQSARQTLIGKMTPESLALTALKQYCSEAGINNESSGIRGYQTVVTKGDVIKSILDEAGKNDCGLIVLGSHKSFFENNSLGLVVKDVMRKSKTPVLFVPPSL